MISEIIFHFFHVVFETRNNQVYESFFSDAFISDIGFREFNVHQLVPVSHKVNFTHAFIIFLFVNNISENFFLDNFIHDFFVDFNFCGNDWNINLSFNLLDNLLFDDLNNWLLSVDNLLNWDFNDLFHNLNHFNWLFNLLDYLLEFSRFGWNDNFDWSINNFVHNLFNNRFNWYLNGFDNFLDSINVNDFLNFYSLNFDLCFNNWNLLDNFFVDDDLDWNFNSLFDNLDFFCDDWFFNFHNLDSLVRNINSCLHFLDLDLFNWSFSVFWNNDWFFNQNLFVLRISDHFNGLNRLLINFFFSNDLLLLDNSFDNSVNKFDFLVGNNFFNFLDLLNNCDFLVYHKNLFLNLFHLGGNHWDFFCHCNFFNVSIDNCNFSVLWYFHNLNCFLFNHLCVFCNFVNGLDNCFFHWHFYFFSNCSRSFIDHWCLDKLFNFLDNLFLSDDNFFFSNNDLLFDDERFQFTLDTNRY